MTSCEWQRSRAMTSRSGSVSASRPCVASKARDCTRRSTATACVASKRPTSSDSRRSWKRSSARLATRSRPWCAPRRCRRASSRRSCSRSLEQRHSLSEIVIALRVPPEDVRELYHTWLVGLWAGELQRKEPALPARHTDQDAIRRVTPVQLAQLLAALPSKQSTRISIARMVGEFVVSDEPTRTAFVEYRNLCELGGFDVSGPIAVADILARVGAGEYRVSAYGFDPRGLRWEVFVRLGEEPS